MSILRRDHWHIAFVFVLATAFLASPGRADDAWSDPFPGIRHLHRTGPSNTNIVAAVVDLCAPGVSVRHSAFEERAQRPSAFARSVGAQWAINGDFSCRPIDVGSSSPFPPCRGFPEYMTYGVAAHAGVAWPTPPFHDALLAFAEGRVEIYPYEARQPFEPWMQEVISGHWGMIHDGAITTACGDESPSIRPPRTVIGLSADRTQLILAVADGRGIWNGQSCRQMAELLLELGAWNGFNLDGGGSSTMWSSEAGVLNHPSDGSERVVGPTLAIFATGSGPAPHCDRPFEVHPEAALPSVVASGPRGRLRAAASVRLFDTRDASSTPALEGLSLDAAGRVAGGSTLSFDGLPSRGVPAGSAAAVIRLAAVDPATGGFVNVFAADAAAPNTSSLNFAGGVSASNLALTGLDDRARFAVSVSSPTHLVAELDGYFGPTGSGFVPMAPARALDSRTDGGPLQAGLERALTLAAPLGTTALALDVVTVGGSSAGTVLVHPCGEDPATGVPIGVSVARALSSAVLARTGPHGLCLLADTTTDVIVDVTGAFVSNDGLDYQSIVPARLIDTRQTTGPWLGRVPSGTTAEISLSRAPGYPADAEAVALNVTAVSPGEDGYVSFHPCDEVHATTSSLNFAASQTVANAVIVSAPGGRVCAATQGRTHLVVDLVGVFVPPLVAGEADAGIPSADAAGVGPDAAGPRAAGGCAVAPRRGGLAASWALLGLALARCARAPRRRADTRRPARA